MDKNTTTKVDFEARMLMLGLWHCVRLWEHGVVSVSISLIYRLKKKNEGFDLVNKSALMTHQVMLLARYSVACSLITFDFLTCLDCLEPLPSILVVRNHHLI